MRLPALLAGCLLFTTTALAQPPNVTEFVSALIQRHPEFLATRARTDQAASVREEADAQFDLRLVQETYVRPSGYYDGRYAEQGIVQPLGPMNAEVFGSYRISDGSFPVYEADYQTLDQGEASIGVKLSLLQNRDTDSRRLALTSAAFNYLEAESTQDVALNKLIYRAVSTWLEWYQSHQKLQVVRNLLTLTRSRLRAVETRVEGGDLAEISLTEFRATLLQREVLEQEAEQRYELAQRRLAYFWRPEPEVAGESAARAASLDEPPPEQIQWPYKTTTTEPYDLAESIAEHPGLSALQAKVDQARNRKQLAQNEVLPQLDLEVKLAQDLGEGVEALDGTESVVGLSFYMPLGQRGARAREAVANAEIRELEYEARVLKEQIERDIGVSLKALQYSRQILNLSRQQEQLASQLLNQELTRFNAGMSDQFLLISRESAFLQAQLKRVDAHIEVLRNELSLHATLAKLAPSAT